MIGVTIKVYKEEDIDKDEVQSSRNVLKQIREEFERCFKLDEELNSSK